MVTFSGYRVTSGILGGFAAVLIFSMSWSAAAALSSPLQYGDRGPQVAELQRALKDRGYFDHEITENFGPVTQDAVIKFQKANGISPAAGYFGPLTLAKLKSGVSPSGGAVVGASTPAPLPNSENTITKDELDIISSGSSISATMPDGLNCDVTSLSSRTARNMVIITHGWNDNATDPNGWVQQMARSIATSIITHYPNTKNDWTVCAYDWQKDANEQPIPKDQLIPWASGSSIIIGPEKVFGTATGFGQQLGVELSKRNLASIHLIGHSAGSNIIQNAAVQIRGISSATNIHLTFLDAYDPNGIKSIYGSDERTQRSLIAHNPTWFADQYFDTRGYAVLVNTNISLPYAYNFDVTNLDGFQDTQSEIAIKNEIASAKDDIQFGKISYDHQKYLNLVHAWPYKWYQQTIDDFNAGKKLTTVEKYGFPLSLESGVSSLPTKYELGGDCKLTSDASTCPLVTISPTPPSQTLPEPAKRHVPINANHELVVELFNIDDRLSLKLNGKLAGQVGYLETRSFDLSKSLAEGENTLTLELSNNPGAGWTYGFRIVADGVPVVEQSCGTVSKLGCNGNDQSAGLVFVDTYTVIKGSAGGVTAPITPTQTPSVSASCSFTRDLSQGVSGSDVLCLQRYLNSSGFVIAASGPGSPGNETNYFGPLMSKAVSKWQTANSISPASGNFGALSRAKFSATPALPTPVSLPLPPTACVPNWQCNSWSICSSGQQSRTCTDSNNCGVSTNKPASTQSCSQTSAPDPTPIVLPQNPDLTKPYCNLSITKTHILSGQKATIYWAARNLTHGTLSNGAATDIVSTGSDSTAKSGSFGDVAPTETTTYSATFTGPNGSCTTASLTVTIDSVQAAGKLQLSIRPQVVTPYVSPNPVLAKDPSILITGSSGTGYTALLLETHFFTQNGGITEIITQPDGSTYTLHPQDPYSAFVDTATASLFGTYTIQFTDDTTGQKSNAVRFSITNNTDTAVITYDYPEVLDPLKSYDVMVHQIGKNGGFESSIMYSYRPGRDYTLSSIENSMIEAKHNGWKYEITPTGQ